MPPRKPPPLQATMSHSGKGKAGIGGLGRHLFRASGTMLVLQIGGAALSLLLGIVLGRSLGKTAYGEYAYALAWINVLLIPAMLGQGTAAVRFVAEYAANARHALLRGFLRRSMLLVGCASLAVAGIAGSIVFVVDWPLDRRLSFLTALALLPALGLLTLWRGVLQGFRQALRAFAGLLILRPTLTLLAVVAALAVGVKLDSGSALALNVFASIAVLVPVGYWVYRAAGLVSRSAECSYATLRWLRVGIPLLATGALSTVLAQADLVMLGSLRGSAEAGIYAAAIRIAAGVGFGLVAGNAVVAPMIAAHFHAGEMTELRRVLRLTARAVLFFTLLLMLGVIVLGHWALGLFGRGFEDGYAALIILAGAQALNALAGPVAYLMSMTGHQNRAAVILAVAVVVALVLNAVLIPPFGAVGAGLATVGGTLCWNLLMLLHVRAKIGVNPTAFGFQGRNGTAP